jgi:hypothetical protein
MLKQSLLSYQGDVDVERQQWYRKAVGSLNHLATYTRPDLAFAISCLSRHLQNPSKEHEEVLNTTDSYSTTILTNQLSLVTVTQTG